MNNFIKKLAGFSVGPVIGAFISFITIPLTTYFISPTEFGKASMFMVVQSFLVTFIYLGMDQSYAKEYNSSTDKNELFQNALLIPLSTAIFLMIGVSYFSRSFSTLLFDSEDYTLISVLFGIMLVFSVIERFVLLSVRMEEKSFEYSFYSILIKLLILIFTMLFILWGDKKFTTVVYGTIFGQIAGDLFLILKHFSLLKIKKRLFNKKLVNRMLYFGIPMIVAASINNLLNTSGRFFLRGYSTYSELGIYNVALKISAIITIVQTAFTSFWVPTAYRWHENKKDMKHFNAISEILLLIMTIMFFSILLLKKYIVLIVSSKYVDAQYVVGMLSMIPILYTLSETTTLGIVFSGKSYYNVWISVISIIPNLILCYLLVPTLGTRGAAIGAAVSYVFFCILRTGFSNKSGFVISFKKQFINIIVFFLAAVVNLFDSSYTLSLTIILFIVSIGTQMQTFTTIFEIKNNPNTWDFN